jgi:hypothetical protein
MAVLPFSLSLFGCVTHVHDMPAGNVAMSPALISTPSPPETAARDSTVMSHESQHSHESLRHPSRFPVFAIICANGAGNDGHVCMLCWKQSMQVDVCKSLKRSTSGYKKAGTLEGRPWTEVRV